ncbi:hypothetical protein OG784_31820 [Streptomyces sp. NBC_01617]|uniref:hypothetical protein n=1 Tax=unclassified Streptomyces TaxID=2593676 RepID=UPI00386639D5|nr:hypothetical protein OG987_31970 [Streptomyces sp. NBC_01620]WTE63038.1 hypothetical protein OG784_31820 [Streptomyces sp. NBC_01617]
MNLQALGHEPDAGVVQLAHLLVAARDREPHGVQRPVPQPGQLRHHEHPAAPGVRLRSALARRGIHLPQVGRGDRGGLPAAALLPLLVILERFERLGGGRPGGLGYLVAVPAGLGGNPGHPALDRIGCGLFDLVQPPPEGDVGADRDGAVR